MLVVQLPILDLSIMDLRDLNSIAISDISQYLVLPTSSQVSLQIVPPGYPMISVPFIPGSVNVYRCADLGITCGVSDCCPLPDGIYDVIYSVNNAVSANANTNQPVSIEKTFIRVNKIKCSLNKAFCKVDMECGCLSDQQKLYKKQIDRADLFIDGAVAAVNDCNNGLAFRLYSKAETILNTLCCQFGLPTTSCNQCAPCAITASCSSCQ